MGNVNSISILSTSSGDKSCEDCHCKTNTNDRQTWTGSGENEDVPQSATEHVPLQHEINAEKKNDNGFINKDKKSVDNRLTSYDNTDHVPLQHEIAAEKKNDNGFINEEDNSKKKKSVEYGYHTMTRYANNEFVLLQHRVDSEKRRISDFINIEEHKSVDTSINTFTNHDNIEHVPLQHEDAETLKDDFINKEHNIKNKKSVDSNINTFISYDNKEHVPLQHEINAETIKDSDFINKEHHIKEKKTIETYDNIEHVPLQHEINVEKIKDTDFIEKEHTTKETKTIEIYNDTFTSNNNDVNFQHKTDTLIKDNHGINEKNTKFKICKNTFRDNDNDKIIKDSYDVFKEQIDAEIKDSYGRNKEKISIQINKGTMTNIINCSCINKKKTNIKINKDTRTTNEYVLREIDAEMLTDSFGINKETSDVIKEGHDTKKTKTCINIIKTTLNDIYNNENRNCQNEKKGRTTVSKNENNNVGTTNEEIHHVSFINDKPLIINDVAENPERKTLQQIRPSIRDSHKTSLSKKPERVTQKSSNEAINIDNTRLSNVRNSLELLQTKKKSLQLQETPNTIDSQNMIGTNIKSVEEIFDMELLRKNYVKESRELEEISEQASTIYSIKETNAQENVILADHKTSDYQN